MKEKYWERFIKTGRIEDYLSYKGMEICQNIMEKYEEKRSEPGNNSNRDGAFIIANWRI